ncbi:MAG: hypothetical protein SGJ03_12120 [Alphaproteobacteria bacterium]|nr:hypothetical protein [Alphaproteobacteria bacterium]
MVEALRRLGVELEPNRVAARSSRPLVVDERLDFQKSHWTYRL